MAEYIEREAAIAETRKPRLTDAELRRRLSFIPAADVVPVRHGRWIKSPECPEEYDICSVCGKNDKHRSRGNWEHDMVESVPPFCKWCGARMDLVTDCNQVKDVAEMHEELVKVISWRCKK